MRSVLHAPGLSQQLTDLGQAVLQVNARRQNPNGDRKHQSSTNTCGTLQRRGMVRVACSQRMRGTCQDGRKSIATCPERARKPPRLVE